MTHLRARLWLLLVVGLALALPAAARPRVVVLGFDGASADRVAQWMADGTLPNLAKLAAAGTFAPLQTTNPPQSPIAWASFATGTWPGKTNQFDFLSRNPDDYALELALAHPVRRPLLFGSANGRVGGALVCLVGAATALLLRRRRKAALAALVVGLAAAWPTAAWIEENLPESRVVVENNTRGTAFWERAAQAGLQVVAMDVPDTFPPRAGGPGGSLLSGLGVPDIRGTIGTYTMYTTDPSVFGDDEPELGGRIIVVGRGASIRTKIPGPVIRRASGMREVSAPLSIEVGADEVRVSLDGEPFVLRPGEWSDWKHVAFHPFFGVTLHGACRFHLNALRPRLALYMSPVSWDPAAPPAPISDPPGFAPDLAAQVGPFNTLGWKHPTWALNGGHMDEATYVEASRQSQTEAEKRAFLMLGRKPDVFVQVYTETDCTQHMFERFVDPASPLWDPAAAKRFGGEIKAAYQRMDDMVGKVQATLGPDDLLLVVSDHGFAPYRRSVSLNRWLADHGYQKRNPSSRRNTLENLFVRGRFWDGVVWRESKAYAFGLGQIFLNRVGREAEGTVSAEEARAVRREIADGLRALRDPANGAPVVAGVWTRDDLYDGPWADHAPDLRVAFRAGYRVSWQDTMGGADPQVLSDNLTRWSGDHCSSDPRDVPGIIVCNRRLALSSPPRIIDVAPTVLQALGLPAPDDCDGRSLLPSAGTDPSR